MLAAGCVRICDCILTRFCSPQAIFDVALRTLRLAEKRLLPVDDAFDALVVLNELTSTLYDADVLFQVKLKHSVDGALVKLLRQRFRSRRLAQSAES